MKYMQDGGFQSNPLMRLTLGLTLVFLLMFWGTSWAMYFQRMGLTPESVVTYYRGNEESFKAPISLGSMTETSHMHMPMMGMVLLFLTHLAIFVPISRGPKIALVLATFLGAIGQEAAGWLVRFVSPAFAWLKILGFFVLQISIAILLVALGLFLWRSARKRPKTVTSESPQLVSKAS